MVLYRKIFFLDLPLHKTQNSKKKFLPRILPQYESKSIYSEIWSLTFDFMDVPSVSFTYSPFFRPKFFKRRETDRNLRKLSVN